MTDLAIYDMDRTITRRATYTPFLLYCATKRAPWRLALTPAVVASMVAYLAGTISRGRLKEINHRLLIGRVIGDEQLRPLTEGFAEATLRDNIRPGALKAIARDRAEGRRLVMATASYSIYVDAIARRLGFDDVVATQSVRDDAGRLVALIDGENCYGAAKKRMIDGWLARSGIARGHVRFYSDHASDAPVFEWVDEPVAVNPHAKLRRLAHQRGWGIEDWG